MKKYLLTLIILTFGIFGNSLFNDFTGDDYAIIVENTFYSKLSNIHSLFTKEYTTDPLQLNQGDGKNYGSDSVAYRPVLSTTYFFDYAFWGKKAFGYHLTNLLLHTANVLLVFLLFLRFIPNPAWACFSAMLFAVHPIHSETVCAIGYRADLLSTLFVLLSCLSWIYFRERQKSIWGLLTLGTYSLAIFSKESAFFTPLLLWLYDSANKPDPEKKGLLFAWRGVFVLIGAIYLWVYLYVFPNPALTRGMLPGENPLVLLGNVLQIWGFNLFSLLCLWSVTAVPPLYAFNPVPFPDSFLLISLVLSLFIAGTIFIRSGKTNGALFWLGWFFLFYIPVAGIIATPNPVAYRYLYLPSIGFIAIAGCCLCQILERPKIKVSYSLWFKVLIIGACCICTFFNNFLWRNNYTISKQWVKDYPGYYKGYQVLGIEYFRRFKFQEAVATLQPFWHELRTIDVSALYCLAEGHLQLGHFDQAEYFFNDLLKLYPRYSDAYFGLGKICLVRNDFSRALDYFTKAIDIEPKTMYFAHLLARSQVKENDQPTALRLIDSLKQRYGEKFDEESMQKKASTGR